MDDPGQPAVKANTKAISVYILGWVAVVTGPLIGGIVPAVIAMVLARQARRDIEESEGWLTGASFITRGEGLATAAIGLAALTVAAAVVVAVLTGSADPPHDFPPTVN